MFEMQIKHDFQKYHTVSQKNPYLKRNQGLIHAN